MRSDDEMRIGLCPRPLLSSKGSGAQANENGIRMT